MWARNLLFAAVCLAGGLALAASLAPVHARRAAQAIAAEPPADLAPAIARLDAAFQPRWTEAGLTPAPAATDLTVLRRLALALTGTIPSVEEIRRIEAHAASDAVPRWLAQRFADRRTSDYLAERLARAFVGTEDGPFLIFRRRRLVSWLADEIHAGRPYDQIVAQLIAADGLWTDSPATNFVTVTIRPDDERGPDSSRLAARVARGMLGVRLDCAECHDHPFAPWKQADFQALAAFFGSTEHSLRGVRDAERSPTIHDAATGAALSVTPAVPFAAELLPAAGTGRARLARWVTHRDNRAFALATANRAWAIMFGRPLVEPIDDLPVTDPPEPLAILAEDFVAHGYDLRRLLSVVALSDVYRRDSRPSEDVADATTKNAPASIAPPSWNTFPLTRLRPEQVVGSIQQSASLATLDYESHILFRVARVVGQSEFVKRYGDSGADEFAPQAGTIPQRLLLMNGDLIHERTKDDLVANAATQIAALASTDEVAVEIAYLACLTRRPTVEEREHFAGRLDNARGAARRERMQDLYWALLNSTEFSWNH